MRILERIFILGILTLGLVSLLVIKVNIMRNSSVYQIVKNHGMLYKAQVFYKNKSQTQYESGGWIRESAVGKPNGPEPIPNFKEAYHLIFLK